MKNRILTAITILFLFSGVQAGEGEKDSTAVFEWQSDFCEYAAIYDATLYTETELQNTLELYWNYPGLNTGAVTFRPEGIDEFSLDELLQEYSEKKKHLSSMDIVDTEYWQNFRKQKLQEIKDQYELKKITIESYKIPGVLLDNRFTEGCEKYAEALNADTTKLFKAWRDLLELKKKDNCCPDEMEKEFLEERYSDNNVKHAVVYLTSFGWWNCANQKVRYVQSHSETFDEFKKLFIEITKEDCDMP